MAGGVNYTLANAQETSDTIERAEQNGEVRMAYDSYTSGGTAGTIIYMFDKLPKGAVVMGIYLYCDWADASSTLDIGDGDDDNRYMDAIDTSSAVNGWQSLLTGGLGYTIGTNDDDDQIQLTTGGATVSGTVKMIIMYSV